MTVPGQGRDQVYLTHGQVLALTAEARRGRPADPAAQGLAFITMTTAPPPTAFLHLVVGYDGSPPATRALDAAILLLNGRSGHIDVLYVTHTAVIAEDPIAPADIEPGQVTRDLRAMAAEQLRDRGASWGFEHRQGVPAPELSAVAADVRDANPGRFVMIVVGSSSSAIHRVAGSVAVGLGRHPPVPLLIVP
jgi:nucleotide-binding universal stress UspA family protein